MVTAAIMPATAARGPTRRQNSASNKLPSSAPLVKPRTSIAAFRTNGTLRVSHATPISAAAQNTVEFRLKRKKNSSSLRGQSRFTKSIVETDDKAVKAELILDIAAESIATIRKPRNRCGTYGI